MAIAQKLAAKLKLLNFSSDKKSSLMHLLQPLMMHPLKFSILKNDLLI